MVTPEGTLAVARRVEASEAEAIAASARAFAARGKLARVARVAGGWLGFSGAGLPVNRAVGLGMAGPVAAADLDEVEKFYEALGAPAQVDVCPYADGSLVGLLGSRGYTLLRFFAVLVRRLDGPVPAAEPAAASEVLRVERIDAGRAELWAQTAARAFTGRDTFASDDMNLVLARAAAAQASVRCFMATWDDRPVGVGAVRLHEGCATLFSAATLPAFRGRGVQSALVAARLAEARREGCDLGVVPALPGSDSERNLERLGFRGSYTRAVTVRRI